MPKDIVTMHVDDPWTSPYTVSGTLILGDSFVEGSFAKNPVQVKVTFNGTSQTTRVTSETGDWTKDFPWNPKPADGTTVTVSAYTNNDPYSADPVLQETTLQPVPLRAATEAAQPAEGTEAAAADGVDYGGDQVTIVAPSAGGHVITPFTAYGTVTGASLTVTGVIISSGGTQYPGTTVMQGPNWQIQFDSPGYAPNATLKVTQGGTGASAQETITIELQS